MPFRVQQVMQIISEKLVVDNYWSFQEVSLGILVGVAKGMRHALRLFLQTREVSLSVSNHWLFLWESSFMYS